MNNSLVELTEASTFGKSATGKVWVAVGSVDAIYTITRPGSRDGQRVDDPLDVITVIVLPGAILEVTETLDEVVALVDLVDRAFGDY